MFRVPSSSVRTFIQIRCMFGVYYSFALKMNKWEGLLLFKNVAITVNSFQNYFILNQLKNNEALVICSPILLANKITSNKYSEMK